MSEKLRKVLSGLDGVRETGDQYKALCPAHDDQDPSLTIKEGDNGGVVLYCQAGCKTEAIVRALDLEWSDLFEDVERNQSSRKSSRQIETVYDYVDEEGRLLFQQVRFSPKGFGFRRSKGNGEYDWSLDNERRVLYRLREVIEAVASNKPVFVVEGEKDTDRLAQHGVTATTNPGGAGKWREEYSACLRGATVVIIPDHDASGKDHGTKVADSLRNVAESVKVVDLSDMWSGCPEKGDVSDFLDAGNTIQALLDHVEATEEYTPETDSPATQDHGVGVSGEFDHLFKSTRQLAIDTPSETPYVVEGLVYEASVTLLSGVPKGSGKTTLITHLVASIVNGDEFAGMACMQGPVVILTEQSRQSFEKEYLEPRGLMDRDDVFVCYLHEAHGVPWQKLIEGAFSKCREVGALLMVIDTLAAFAGFVSDGENNSGTVNKVMEPVTVGAAQSGVAVLIAHHSRKSGGQLWESSRGSSALTGAVDIIAYLQPTEGQRDTMRKLDCMGRFAATNQTRYLELTENGYVDRGSGSAPVLRSNKELIRDIVPVAEDGALTADDLFRIAQDRDPSVKRTRFDDGLREHVEAGTIKRRGVGKKGGPYRYSHHRTGGYRTSCSRKGNPMKAVSGESSGGYRVVTVRNGPPILNN